MTSPRGIERAVTRLIDTLVDRGLVERRPDPTDHRSWSVLTPKGSDLVASSRRPVVRAREELFDGFRDDELRTPLGLLDRIDAWVRALLAPDEPHQ